jgi:hypothetical protein
MTTQPAGDGSDDHDTEPHGGPPHDHAEVERRPDTAGYPSAEDAGAPGAEDPPVSTDERDRAGYPDASDAPEPS